MFDTRPALANMATQIRFCRSTEGMTLQQLASRSGVAASTIHKVESQQMVPTVSVLLKIARGLGRRPDELIRDESTMDELEEPSNKADAQRANGIRQIRSAGAWKIELMPAQRLENLELESDQRAIVLVEQGAVDLHSGTERVRLTAGDCVEVGGGRTIENLSGPDDPTRLTLIVTPARGFNPDPSVRARPAIA